MSLRLRLTLLYSAILALTLVVFSGALYLTVARSTRGVIEEALAGEAKRLAGSSRFRLDDIDYPVRKFAAPETYVQTRYIDGSVIDRSGSLGDFTLPLSDNGLRLCQQGQPVVEVAPTINGRLLVYNQPVRQDGALFGVVQVARSLADYDQSLDTLRRLIIIGTSVVTVVAFGIGWVLAGAALRPISRITQTAQAIGTERDFGRRVPSTGPHDEVGRLATTFNAMLAELQAAFRQVEQALQAQRRFVADASHELRTPLTTIRGNLGLLQRSPPISAADREAVLDDMADESDRLIRLVNDLLALARADAGRPLRSEPVPLKPLLDEVCRQVQALAPTREISCDADDALVALGDRDALKQIVLILLDNALAHTPPDAQIAVEAAAGDGHVTVSVCDNGPGIEAAVLPYIFERFYQADTARTGAGAGLGLSIARALAEGQHGSISVESAVGHGSRFSVRVFSGSSG